MKLLLSTREQLSQWRVASVLQVKLLLPYKYLVSLARILAVVRDAYKEHYTTKLEEGLVIPGYQDLNR
jgi:hypothetical protein